MLSTIMFYFDSTYEVISKQTGAVQSSRDASPANEHRRTKHWQNEKTFLAQLIGRPPS